MPIRKNPRKLTNISFDHSFALICQACSNIYETYESYDNPQCIVQISHLNQFLSSNLCPAMLEEMLIARERSIHIKDTRIIIAALTNIQTRNFKIDTTRDLYIPKSFWASLLCCLKNLTSLDLALICTDGILNVVGNSCLNLEYINATSSYKRIQSDFNALLLSRTVTDKGLNSLMNCQQLRKIIIDEPRGKFTHGITCKGVEKLIRNLKFLEEISCSDVGSIIDNGYLKDLSLKLTKITQFRTSVLKIKAIERTCPNLKCLILTNFRLDEIETYKALDYLAQSNINLENIKLSYFTYYPSVQKYFQFKGEYLTCVTFVGESNESIGTEALIEIGLFCPNIMLLHVEKLSNHNLPINEFKTSNIFIHLRNLLISGSLWDVEKVIPICLSYVCNIQSISLNLTDTDFHKLNIYCIENCLNRVIKQNPTILKSIKIFSLYNPITLSINFIEMLLKKCDIISSLNVWSNELEKCEQIKKKLMLENYDVDFQFDLKLELIT